MNATIQETLLDLFNQVIENPEHIPGVPIDTWQEGSEERHLLTGFRDMLERLKQSEQHEEQQLREREEQYRSIFEATYDGLAILDPNGCYVEVNPAFCRMFGYTREELIGMHVSALAPPLSQPNVAEAMDAFKAGRGYQAIGDALRKDGTVFVADARSTLFTYRSQRHRLVVARDVTERVEAEKQLREKEGQYRSIFEATTDAMFISDLDGYVVEVNPMTCKMYGYSYDELIGLHGTTFTPIDLYPRLGEVLHIVQAGGQYQGQSVALRKNGSAFPIEVYATTFTYKRNPHILAVVRDITERIQAEQALREKEEQYRSVFEATDDGMNIADLDGYFIEVNPAFCRMLGYTREELIGLHYSQTTFPEYYPVVEESTRTIGAGDRYQTQGLAQRKDGSPLPVEAHATPFMYKGKPHVLGVMRDITERVEAEKQLREREEQYRSVFEATNDALGILDLKDGHIVEVNPALCDIYGYSYEELIGLPSSAVIHPDKLPGLIEKGLPLIRAGGKRHIQGVNLCKDGSAFPIDLHQTVFTYQGKPHMLCVIRDITEQVQAQQLLEQRVEERTRELSTLLEVSHNVASTLELKSLLGLILEQLKVVAEYDGATVTIVEGEYLVIIDYRGTDRESMLGWRFPLKQLGPIRETIRRQEVVMVDDVHGDTSQALAYRQAVGDLQSTVFASTHAWMAVPMMLKERVMGVLNLSSREPRAFTSRHAALALGIANQAAIAIENARLYEQAQELAALEERQKLARELHDSVSQALYGISLGAHAARTALDRDPDHVAEPLDYVLMLAEAALAEMRALIFELRPESLESEGLVSALSKQAAALHARHELVVSTELCDEPDLSLHTKQELYRIAQEALHNTVKHARASHVTLHLQQAADAVILEIRDDGVGFDTSGSFPGHLGLHSMRERVVSLDGTFEIESTLGVGTRICVSIPGRVRLSKEGR